ncbi:NRDE family protein [Falsiroseomonas sp. E2-1-a20]|uniref:NRDE family protein n=1 Tax=Falsiroseomonas sp. E2-1-a20 TaxID=3239300 RepID=UPI003F363FC2
MCTVILLRRPGHSWPLLLAANRDERLDRAWDAPAAHWPDRPEVAGGRDRMAGGTWMAAGRGGLVSAILNRPGSLGPAAGKASRGALPLMAASQRSAHEAADRLSGLDAGSFRPFNLIVADRDEAFFLRAFGEGRPEVQALPEGVSMVTAHDANDVSSPRIRRHLPRFEVAAPPDPSLEDWAAWEALLADDSLGPAGLADALRVPAVKGFGTICASLFALGASGAVRWRFCPAPAGMAAFRDIPLPGG